MRIVAIGGGTGLSTLLQGLKKYTDQRTDGAGALSSKVSFSNSSRVTDLTAVVTVSDDGGSSGRLRRDFQVLAPGDIRNCMVALSEDEALMSRLFQYRFPGGRGLKGHSFGNLFLTALTSVTGDFQEAVKLSGEVLAIRGRIFPSTMSDVRLEAEMEDGRIIQGETRISRTHGRIARIRLSPSPCRSLPQTLDAIEQADVITVGPGSLFTSVVPNLLVEGVAPAIARSRGIKIYVANLMTQPGETSGFTAADHLRTIEEHCGHRFFDAVLLNGAPIPLRLQRRYLAQRSRPVMIDLVPLMDMGLRVVTANLVPAERQGEAQLKASKWVRHDPARLAKAVIGIASRRAEPAGLQTGLRTRLRKGSSRRKAS
jgi:uncharacterized cofD-like protein